MSLTAPSLEERVKSDLGDVKKAQASLGGHIQSSLESIDGLNTKLQEDLLLSQGLDFLDVKNHLMLSYLIDMTYVMYRKCSGESISSEPAVDRLAETRTVLEKMRPIDQKLKYQIDKLTQAATTQTINPDDPLRLRARPGNLVSKLDEDSASENESSGEEEDNEEDKSKTKTKAYVPPKMSAVHYGDETEQERRQRLLEHARKRALSSNIMQELRREYDEGPEEITESRDLHRVRDDKRRREKTDYEENYMTRLMVTKQEKHKSRQMATMSSLSELAHFEDISALEANPDEFPLKKKKIMSRGFSPKNKKKSKKVFKRKRH